MPIKFTCTCGKRLRARDEMAARRSVCPRCGSPVGIPSRQIGPKPPTPAERLRGRIKGPATGPLPGDAVAATAWDPQPPVSTVVVPGEGVPVPQPLDTNQVTKPKAAAAPPRKRKQGWSLETQWHDCLVYPFRAFPIVFFLAVALTGISVGTAFLLPRVFAGEEGMTHWLLHAPLVLIPLAILGYACGFLDCTLNSASTGRMQQVRYPGVNLLLVVRSCATWFLCFLAGPAELIVGGFFYWTNCGEPDFIDYWILGEMGIIALAYWLLLLLTVSRRDRLRDAHPGQVVELVKRLGHQTVVVALSAAVLAYFHAMVAFIGLQELHREPGLGLLLLLVSWLSGLGFSAFLFRLLSVWCLRCKV